MARQHDERTVQIPFKVVKGKLMYFYGGQLPSLADGRIGDILVPESALVNPGDRARCGQQSRETLLEAGTKLLLRMRQATPDPKRHGCQMDLQTVPPSYGMFVAVVLEEELLLLLRGTKRGRLE